MHYLAEIYHLFLLLISKYSHVCEWERMCNNVKPQFLLFSSFLRRMKNIHVWRKIFLTLSATSELHTYMNVIKIRSKATVKRKKMKNRWNKETLRTKWREMEENWLGLNICLNQCMGIYAYIFIIFFQSLYSYPLPRHSSLFFSLLFSPLRSNDAPISLISVRS